MDDWLEKRIEEATDNLTDENLSDIDDIVEEIKKRARREMWEETKFMLAQCFMDYASDEDNSWRVKHNFQIFLDQMIALKEERDISLNKE